MPSGAYGADFKKVDPDYSFFEIRPEASAAEILLSKEERTERECLKTSL